MPPLGAVFSVFRSTIRIAHAAEAQAKMSPFWGHRCGKNRVARLMRESGLRARQNALKTAVVVRRRVS